eukprot:s3246_g3.t1
MPRYLQFRDRVVFVVGEAAGPSPAKRLRLLEPLAGRRLPLALCLARDGFVASAGALGASEAAKALTSLDQHAARVLGPGAQAEDLRGEQRFKIHLLYPWAARLVTHPSLLEAATGPHTGNVLVWFSEVNAKGPLSSLHAAPHQDFIFASLAPNDAVLTAWLALTDAATEMGGLFFRRHSHLHGQLPHCVDDKAENLIGFHCCDAEFLAGAQDGEDEDAVPVELGAGEASLHTFRTLHWSGPNLTNERRGKFGESGKISGSATCARTWGEIGSFPAVRVLCWPADPTILPSARSIWNPVLPAMRGPKNARCTQMPWRESVRTTQTWIRQIPGDVMLARGGGFLIIFGFTTDWTFGCYRQLFEFEKHGLHREAWISF